MSHTLRIKITGELPLPDNAFDAARLTLAVDGLLHTLREFLGQHGGGMTDKCWTVQKRDRGRLVPPHVPGPVSIGEPPPKPSTWTTAGPPATGVLAGTVAVDDPFYIPPFLKGGAP